MDLTNVNGFGGKTIQELQLQFNMNKRPGRRSAEQQKLLGIIEHMQANGLAKLPKKGLVMPAAPLVEDLSEQMEAPELETKPAPKTKGAKAPKAAKQTEEQVAIQPITVGTIEIVVEGTENLIMHAWDVKSKRQIEEKQQKKAKTAREARNPDAEYNAARYVNSKGQDCIPARCFKNAIVEAATFLSDVTKKLIKGGLYVKGDLLPILDRKGKTMKATKREDMVRIGGMSKVADIRYRPEYIDWRVNLSIEFEVSVFSAEQVVNLLNRAGFHVGVGEWRPQFGRFRIIKS